MNVGRSRPARMHSVHIYPRVKTSHPPRHTLLQDTASMLRGMSDRLSYIICTTFTCPLIALSDLKVEKLASNKGQLLFSRKRYGMVGPPCESYITRYLWCLFTTSGAMRYILVWTRTSITSHRLPLHAINGGYR